MKIKTTLSYMVAGLTLATLPASGATFEIVGADSGHGLSPFQLTPAVMMSTPNAPSADYNHQVPIPTQVTVNGIVTLGAAGTAWAPIVAGRPFQRVQARLLVWSATGALLCATPFVLWNQSASAQNKFLGNCTYNPAGQFAEVEFLVGHTVAALGANLSDQPRAISVNYQY